METKTALSIPASITLKSNLTDEQFFQLCRDNNDLQFEHTATGELIIMPPTGGSPGDSLAKIQAKMQEYKENGAKLGWLIDPIRKVVEIYRIDREVEILQSPQTLSGEMDLAVYYKKSP